jgi:GntR family transcriptional regulator/MocR family aminotransferase
VAAGLHLVVELPGLADDVALAAAAREAGLGPLALSACRHLSGLGARAGGGRRQHYTPRGLVLGYATHRPDELVAAVRRLAELVVS